MKIGCLCFWDSVLKSLREAGQEVFLAVRLWVVLSTNPELEALPGTLWVNKGRYQWEPLTLVLTIWILLLRGWLFAWTQSGGSPVSCKCDLGFFYYICSLILIQVACMAPCLCALWHLLTRQCKQQTQIIESNIWTWVLISHVRLIPCSFYQTILWAFWEHSGRWRSCT